MILIIISINDNKVWVTSVVHINYIVGSNHKMKWKKIKSLPNNNIFEKFQEDILQYLISKSFESAKKFIYELLDNNDNKYTKKRNIII